MANGNREVHMTSNDEPQINDNSNDSVENYMALEWNNTYINSINASLSSLY